MSLIVNLFGGPGTGKSTTAAGVFNLLKNEGESSELALEYAKEKVWEETTAVLRDQIYVFAKQLHRIKRLENQVDIVITDSPLLLSLIYGKKYSTQFKNLVISEHESLNNLNIFLKREKEYVGKGRLQTEEEAVKIDTEIRTILVPYKTFEIVANPDAPQKILELIRNV